MSAKELYMRKFVILNERSSDYIRTNNLKPKGHAKIEVRDGKGKLSLNVEGLSSNIATGKVYRGYLVSNDNINLVQVDIGSIMISSNGRGSVNWTFNPLSVGGTGVPINNFNVVLVKLCSKNRYDERVIVPLAGYINKVDGSISSIISKLGKNAEDKDKIETKDEYKSVEKGKLEVEKDVISNENNDTKELDELQEVKVEEKQEEEIKVEKIQENSKKQLEQQESEKTVEEQQTVELKDIEDNTQDINNSKANRSADPRYKYNYNYNLYNSNNYGNSINRSSVYLENAKNYSKQIVNYAINILRFFPEIEPFNEPLEGYKWWEIEYDSKNIYKGFLPFYNYLLNMYYPYPFMTKVTTCQSLIKKYNHYIFGVVEKENEVQYYVYGVPGEFARNEQPYRGATGFTTWRRSKESAKGLGYWLLYIDALSGKIVSPLNPTIPSR